MLNLGVGAYRERIQTAPAFREFLKKEMEKGIQEYMVREQSLLLWLLTREDSLFSQREEDLPYESPLAPVSNRVRLAEDIEQHLREESLLAEQLQADNNDTNTKEEEWLPFVPVTRKQKDYNWGDFSIHDTLLKEFYTVDSTTAVDISLFNLKELQSRDMTLKKDVEGPQILIYHTHSSEAFADSVAGEEGDTILGAGQRLTELLTETYGYQVLHHTGRYDIEKRDYAYSEALTAIEEVLKENPTIEVVIDLHRDAVAEGTRLVTEIEGRDTAKVMFFNGLSRTREKGEISYLPNPYLQQNLSFSFQMQALCNEYYPGFARKIYLRAYRYNMHLCPKTLLIELGAQTNTVEEIENALEPLAHVLHMVLSGEGGES